MRLLLAALLGFGCGEPDILTQAPVPARDLCEEESVEIDPTGLAFGRLVPGTSRVREAMLTYKGCEPTTLVLESDGLFSEDCDRGAFCFEEPPKLDLMPGESVPIRVKFQPLNVGLALGGFIVSGCPTRRCRAVACSLRRPRAARPACTCPWDLLLIGSGSPPVRIGRFGVAPARARLA